MSTFNCAANATQELLDGIPTEDTVTIGGIVEELKRKVRLRFLVSMVGTISGY